WRGGAFELGLNAFWYLGTTFDTLIKRYANAPVAELVQALETLVSEINRLPSEGYRSLPLQDFEPFRRLGVETEFAAIIAHSNSREYSQAYSIPEFYNRVNVPAYTIGGWYDIFSQTTLESFNALRMAGSTTAVRQSKALIGPWTHIKQSHVIGEMDFGFKAQMGWMNLQTDLTSLTQRWFDYWLKGIDNGITNEPPVKLFVMGDNVWRDEQEWPLARTQYTPFYLHSGGQLSTQSPDDEPADHFSYDPAQPTPTKGGALLLHPLFVDGVWDQRSIEARDDVLVYRSEPQTQDTEVTGPVIAKLWACSDAPDTDFVARLVDVHPDGFAQNLTDGITRARYRNGDVPALLQPDKPCEFTINLWSTANVFKAGHRIQLDIASANFPRWDRNPNTGAPFGSDAAMQVAHQTILHDTAHPSHVVLPIIRR
ncbi:MAG: CocE/NonD family hydrolase, partial [Aggregatilineales bacterium]